MTAKLIVDLGEDGTVQTPEPADDEVRGERRRAIDEAGPALAACSLFLPPG